jgi:hypothetical protein
MSPTNSGLWRICYEEIECFEWHRWFKEGQDDQRSGQPKAWRTDANVDRVWTLVNSDQRLGMRLIAELNMTRETAQQIILTDDQKCQLHISSDLLHSAEMFDRVITGDETRSFQWPRNKMPQHIVENRIHLGHKNHSCLAHSSRPCLFLQSQGDSSLLIHCARTNGESTVLTRLQNLARGKAPNSGLISGFSTTTMPLHMMH